MTTCTKASARPDNASRLANGAVIRCPLVTRLPTVACSIHQLGRSNHDHTCAQQSCEEDRRRCATEAWSRRFSNRLRGDPDCWWWVQGRTDSARPYAKPTGELQLSAGAGEGNRTLVCSLGSCRSTIELRPLSASLINTNAARTNRAMAIPPSRRPQFATAARSLPGAASNEG